ncbi:MAG: CoA-acylating methylmalonate-semialdehyde dehydrogenase [Alphaproteobacteria bacterium]|nr:CoA-acylating methylmalonate-semialdehyde dehydrogenase [Alphaproteobacteria bacterium]
MAETLYHFINGERTAGDSGRFGDVFNPATGEVSGNLPYASPADVDQAVQSGLAAQPAWEATASPRRAAVIFKFRELVIQNMDKIAELVGREHGKTIEDAKGSIQRGIDVTEFACGIPHLLKGELSTNVGGGIDTFSMREAVGVVGGITPFNFPVMIPCWMGVMAIACGNAFINKPSERDPSAPLFLAELWKEAGLPDGIWNVVNGDKDAVNALIQHPDVPAISFVGSTLVGEHVYQSGTALNKRVQAFCGAKNHLIVMPDADMDQTVDALMGSGYGSAGERCMAVSVAVPVGKDTADELVKRLEPRVRSLKIGPYNDPAADMGPLITAEAKKRVEGYIDQGVEAGADLVVDGRGTALQGYENGNFVGGTLFDRVTTDMSIYKDEIFGPVLSVARANDFDAAVEMVNGHEYANGVAIFTRDGDAARAFTDQVDVGMIGVNVPIPVPMAFHHFGGSKRSKFGDTQMHGPQSINFFTKMKTISGRWPSGIREGAQFTMPTNR